MEDFVNYARENSEEKLGPNLGADQAFVVDYEVDVSGEFAKSRICLSTNCLIDFLEILEPDQVVTIYEDDTTAALTNKFVVIVIVWSDKWRVFHPVMINFLSSLSIQSKCDVLMRLSNTA